MIITLLSIENRNGTILLFGRDRKGRKVVVEDRTFNPYFYIDFEQDKRDAVLKMIPPEFEYAFVKKRLVGEEKEFIKVSSKGQKSLNLLAEKINHKEGIIRLYEIDVKHEKKYVADKGILPLYDIDVEGEEIDVEGREDIRLIASTIKPLMKSNRKFSYLCFDIETYNPGGVSDPMKDPIVMISYSSSDGRNGVLTWKKSKHDYCKSYGSEKEMIEAFIAIVKEIDPDLLISYNGDNFDLPYLRQRARENKVKLRLGWLNDEVKFTHRGVRGSSASISGLVHIDLYMVVLLLIGPSLKTDSFKLDDVAKEVLGEAKNEVDIANLATRWDKGEIDPFVEYNLQDSILTLKIAEKLMPQLFEISRITGLTPFEASRIGFSKLVESYLIKESRRFNEIVPRKPGRDELSARFSQSYPGAFVVQPKPGFYKNIAVFDFRSLYPSIIVAHNVCPTTLNRGKEFYESPPIELNGKVVRFKFAKSPKGFVPSLVERLILRRDAIKKEMKNHKKGTTEYIFLYAKQFAMKVLTNATYGYLGFPQARWYSIECAASITAWGREYINKVITSAKRKGLKVLYGDTDSVFFLLPTEDMKVVNDFVKGVNQELPSIMALNFEGFFKSGIFVFKKSGSKGAKKKYALCSPDGELTIKGFELVRRDWAPIAKRAQEVVLKKILKENDFKGAEKALFQLVSKLKEEPLESFVIKTRMTKSLSSYGNLAPHVAAALKAKRDGRQIAPGMMVGYVITKGKGRISDRAYTYEMASEKGLSPDYDYYINNQILPSVSEIFRTIGIEINLEKQRRLDGFI